jgi:serine/threonine protein kinase
VRVGNYEILEPLFTAGPSAFFHARNSILGNPVRVRRLTLDPTRPEDARDTFFREMRLSAALWHPHIQKPLDVLEADGYLWSVHEFHATRPTERLVREEGPLSVADAARMGAQLADALAHVHARGHRHGKVSPLTVHVDENGDIQLVNLVKAADLAAGIWPLRPAVLGLSAYSAPEEFHGRRPTAETDLYGLAATIAFWLTAAFPRGGETEEEAMGRALDGAPAVDLAGARADLPPALAEALRAALEVDPDRRRGSIAALATLLVDAHRRLAAEVPPGFETGTRLVVPPHDSEITVLGRQGAGAYGVVFRARRTSDGALLAVKTLKPEHRDDREALERFLREARAIQGIEHPNVVRVHGVGEVRGTPFAAMEFVQGPDLATLLLREGALPPERAARIASGIARGLAAIHADGIVHRDLKPHNVLIAEGDRAVIADFGVARTHAATRLTMTGHLIGTVAYMAPEQFDGEPATAAVDLYALGAILHEMLTGATLYPAADPLQTIQAIRERPMPPLPPEVPPRLARLVARLLEKDPSRRPAGAGAVVEELEAIEVTCGA